MAGGGSNRDRTRARALAYAELRTYCDRLNAVCPGEWESRLAPWGNNRLIAAVLIRGVEWQSIGEYAPNQETDYLDDPRGKYNFGTVAEAQAFKRACARWS